MGSQEIFQERRLILSEFELLQVCRSELHGSDASAGITLSVLIRTEPPGADICGRPLLCKSEFGLK